MLAVERIVIPALNHLLATSAWARERLVPFAGMRAKIEAGFVDLRLEIASDGVFRPTSDTSAAEVTITLPSDFAVLFVVDRKRVFQSARIAGTADFAEALAFVFRHLSWDAEADLASLIGDIPARRLEQLRRGTQAQLLDSLKRTAENVGEYVVEEAHLVVPSREIEQFSGEVNRLRDDCARLEKRLSRL